MMNDDRFDDLLDEAAREHNRAPETPRAEMWAAIAAARGTARRSAPPAAAPAGPTAAERNAPVRVIPLYTRHRRALGWVAGLAATLLVGIEIGRLTSAGSSAPAVDTRTAAATPAPQDAADDGARVGSGPVIPAPVGPSNNATGAGMVAIAPNGGSGAVRPAASNERRAPAELRSAGRGSTSEHAGDAAAPYRLAAMQHLVTTEALLVSLRSDVRAGRTDTTIGVWAGDLLGTTRMLIDSPAARDPQLKQLLEDLELVLAQISRLPGAHGEAADLGLIDDAVRHRQIMTRLRALSPDT